MKTRFFFLLICYATSAFADDTVSFTTPGGREFANVKIIEVAPPKYEIVHPDGTRENIPASLIPWEIRKKAVSVNINPPTTSPSDLESLRAETEAKMKQLEAQWKANAIRLRLIISTIQADGLITYSLREYESGLEHSGTHMIVMDPAEYSFHDGQEVILWAYPSGVAKSKRGSVAKKWIAVPEKGVHEYLSRR